MPLGHASVLRRRDVDQEAQRTASAAGWLQDNTPVVNAVACDYVCHPRGNLPAGAPRLTAATPLHDRIAMTVYTPVKYGVAPNGAVTKQFCSAPPRTELPTVNRANPP